MSSSCVLGCTRVPPATDTPAPSVSEKRRGSRDAVGAPTGGQSTAPRTLVLVCHVLDKIVNSSQRHLQTQGSKACLSKPGRTPWDGAQHPVPPSARPAPPCPRLSCHPGVGWQSLAPVLGSSREPHPDSQPRPSVRDQVGDTQGPRAGGLAGLLLREPGSPPGLPWPF